MSYPAEIVAAAYAALEENRKSAERETARNRAAVFAALPEAEALERDLARASGMVARAILSGEDVEEKVERIRSRNLAGQAQLRELLTAAGFSEHALDDVHRCGLCRDTGVAQDGSVCSCVRQLQRSLMAERLEKSANAAGRDFDSFEIARCAPQDRPLMKKNLAFCREYAQTFSLASENLLLIGDPGLGKTHLSIAIGFAVIDRGYDVLYAPFHRLFGRLEDARFGRSEEEYARVMREALQSELLILDDLGSEMNSSFAAAVLYEIVNTRMVEGRPTIISTNLSENEMIERYRERIHSRLFGTYRKLPFFGEDQRLKRRS